MHPLLVALLAFAVVMAAMTLPDRGLFVALPAAWPAVSPPRPPRWRRRRSAPSTWPSSPPPRARPSAPPCASTACTSTAGRWSSLVARRADGHHDLPPSGAQAMKKLRITVDGKVYDVTVQVLEDDEREIGRGRRFLLRPRRRATAAARQPPAPLAGSAAVRAPPKGDPNADPRPDRRDGAEGLRRGRDPRGGQGAGHPPRRDEDGHLHLRAPRAARWRRSRCAPGDAVQVGDCLIRYRPEA